MINTSFLRSKTLLLATLLHLTSSRTLQHRQHDLKISNESNERVVVDWYNPATHKNIPFATVGEGETIKLNTFSNHTFIFRYDNETCVDQYCRSTVIVVNDNENQVVMVKDGLEVEHRDGSSAESFSSADNIVQRCMGLAKGRLSKGHPASLVMNEMADCVETGTAQQIHAMHEEERFQASLRESMAVKVEDYTCKDNMLDTTQAEAIREWTEINVTRKTHLLHDRQASKIHLIEDFISPEECAAIQEAAAPTLHRGTVADGAGGSKLSDHRKAMQAGIRIPWELEEQGNPITRVFRRIYAYANHATGLELKVDGQEDLMSIQYFGRGEGDKAPDRYKPHCDGDCNGLAHKTGGRVATMVMYCDTEGLMGGATNFGNAGVFVRPTVGAAAFFSYLDPETHVHETGFTTHSGCPVVEGVKRIAVHWMRIGVDNERPWDSFNTNNIHKSECDDD